MWFPMKSVKSYGGKLYKSGYAKLFELKIWEFMVAGKKSI